MIKVSSALENLFPIEITLVQRVYRKMLAEAWETWLEKLTCTRRRTVLICRICPHPTMVVWRMIPCTKSINNLLNTLAWWCLPEHSFALPIWAHSQTEWTVVWTLWRHCMYRCRNSSKGSCRANDLAGVVSICAGLAILKCCFGKHWDGKGATRPNVRRERNVDMICILKLI
jgi:hypothetical protein